jgi:hypothetical protein
MCPRSQLRGSAGFSPASLSLPSGKDAHTERILKERKKLVNGIYWEDRLEVKLRSSRLPSEIGSKFSTTFHKEGQSSTASAQAGCVL